MTHYRNEFGQNCLMMSHQLNKFVNNGEIIISPLTVLKILLVIVCIH